MIKPFVAAALVASAVVEVRAAAPGPNFIVILTDDQGWGTTSVMIDPLVPDSKSDFFKTPNIERLAASGMRPSGTVTRRLASQRPSRTGSTALMSA